MFGATTLYEKELRRAWQNHSEKLASLRAYEAAFIDAPSALQPAQLQAEIRELGRKKMAVLYVDFDDDGIVTPKEVTSLEAEDLLERVNRAVHHATEVFRQLSSEVMPATEAVAPELLTTLGQYFDGMAPVRLIEEMRALLARIRTISASEWAHALETGRVAELLGLTLESER